MRKASDVDIENWALGHCCQIAPLAEEVVIAVRTWEYGLDILTRLVSCKDIRDAVLKRDTLLLPTIVTRAIQEDARSKDVAASVALLQHRLPDHVPLPSVAQDLLCRLFEQAAESPRKVILGSVHLLLKGACWALLEILSPDTLRRFETHVFAILREATDDDPFILLYCLSIMKTLVEGSQTVTASSSQRLAISSPSRNSWKPDAMRSFFDSVKAHKTLQLLAMRVVSACKSEPYMKDRYECVCLTNYVVGGVSQDIRYDWCNKNSAAVRKLHEKCLSQTSSSEIQLQALSFVSALGPRNSYSSQVVTQFAALLKSSSQSGMLLADFEQCLQISADMLERCVDGSDDVVLDALLPRLDTATPDVKRMTTLARSLATISTRSSDMSMEVLMWANLESTVQTLRAMVDEIANKRGESSDDDGSSGKFSTLGLKNELLSSICSLVLGAGLSPNNDDLKLSPRLIPILLRGHAGSFKCGCEVRNVHSRPKLDVNLMSTRQLPGSGPASTQDWRTRLASEMQQEAGQRQQDMTSRIAAICADLEERCANVEEPLHAEQQNRAELESRLCDLEQAYGQLEGQVMDRDLTVSALETEHEKSMISLAQHNTERNDLLQRIESAEERLREISNSARQEIERLQQQNQDKEMDNATALAFKQEALDLIKIELINSEQKLRESETQLEEQKHRCQQYEAETEVLRKSQATKQHELEEAMHKLSSANEQYAVEIRAAEFLRRDLEVERQSISEARKTSDDLRAQLGEVRLTSRQDIERVERDLHSRIDEERQRWRQDQDRMEIQLNQVRQEQQEADEAHDTEQQAAVAKMQEQRKRIERLTKELAKKEAQVGEVQEMRNRLMSAMGLNHPVAQSPPKQSTLPYRSASSASTPHTQVPNTPARETSQTEFDDQISNLSFGSGGSSQPGPTPKRAKPRKAFKVPALQQPRTSTGFRSAKSALRGASAMKRPPLADMSANRSPVRAGRSPSKVTFKKMDVGVRPMSTDNRNALAEWSFTTDVLTSTPGIGLNNVQDELDESTADC